METPEKYNGSARVTIDDDNDVDVCIRSLMDEILVID